MNRLKTAVRDGLHLLFAGIICEVLMWASIVGTFFIVMAIGEQLDSQFASRVAQGSGGFFTVISVASILCAFCIWKFRRVILTKPLRAVDRESEAEIFYGFRKPMIKNKL